MTYPLDLNIMKNQLENMRCEYNSPEMDEIDMAANPIVQLELWLDDAISDQKILTPNAATLSTVSADGTPSSRIILVKEVSALGLVFYTSYDSKKSKDIISNPHVSLLFYFEPHHRQIKINGTVQKISTESSKRYFYSRPHASQAAAAASPQSEPIDKLGLQSRFRTYQSMSTVPFPTHWGGFIVTPTRFEFWQGQPNRLHDCVSYLPQQSGEWQKIRLAP